MSGREFSNRNRLESMVCSFASTRFLPGGSLDRFILIIGVLCRSGQRWDHSAVACSILLSLLTKDGEANYPINSKPYYNFWNLPGLTNPWRQRILRIFNDTFSKSPITLRGKWSLWWARCFLNKYTCHFTLNSSLRLIPILKLIALKNNGESSSSLVVFYNGLNSL